MNLSQSQKVEKSQNVAFIHGRPAPHPMHQAFADSINASSIFVDYKIRWHDIPASPFRRYVSFFVCAFLFPKREQYKFFLSEGFHFMPMLMRFLLLLRRKQKVVYFMDDEGLFFLETNFYSTITSFFVKFFLKNADALICVGEFQASLAKKVLKSKCPPIYQVFNGINEKRMLKLQKAEPDLQSKQILFIANGPTDWRVYYKGLDLIIESFELAKRELPALSLVIIGDWTQEVIQEFSKKSDDVHFVGKVQNIELFLQRSALYLHTARGEAWGISVTEAMAAGVPPVVSSVTGSKEVVEEVDKSLIVDINVNDVKNKILWYFNLSFKERQVLSKKCRLAVKGYTEGNAVQEFQRKFNQLAVDLG